MCFSTEASFSAAAILGAAGGLTLRNASSKSQFFLAAIPLLFAIQQFSEGLVWLHLTKNIGSDIFFTNAERSFLTFAFLIWPLWIPLSFALIEPISWRRSLLFINLYCGIGLSALNLTYAMKEPISVTIVNHSLQYQGHVPEQMILYPVIVMLPTFLSSLRNSWIYGCLVLAAFVVAYYNYEANFTSVWCFFSAIVSVFIYKLIKNNQFSSEKSSKSIIPPSS